MQFTSVSLFILIVFQVFYIMQSSTEHNQHSKESELYDEESLDKTIDDSDKDDSS